MTDAEALDHYTDPDFLAVDDAFAALAEKVASGRRGGRIDDLWWAYTAAREIHGTVRRASGEPYISHPLAVAEILADIELDTPALCAALLHDTVEDTEVELEDIEVLFSAEVAALVDGVTKIRHTTRDAFSGETIPDKSTPDVTRARLEIMRRANTLRKMLIGTTRDLRVIVIKLADRLHNLRTLDALPPNKQVQIATETLQIYAPMAHRVGIWHLKAELEDLAFRYAEPEEFQGISARVEATRTNRKSEVTDAIAILKARLSDEELSDAQVAGRPKHLYSIYQKMLRQDLDLDRIYDLVAVRIIVNTKAQCYAALGCVNSLWSMVPGSFADYIANPKGNNYQSLHLKVIGPSGLPLEVQIRTWEMHRMAEYGVAAHWAYKEKGEGGEAGNEFERRMSRLIEQLHEWQATAKTSDAFLHTVTEDLTADHIFVYTPNRDVIELPSGATPIDFAFRIHSSVGEHAVGARVNGVMVPLSHELKSNDHIEIITRPSGAPSQDWVMIARTSAAKQKIRAYFRRAMRSRHSQDGRDQLRREAERLGLDSARLLKDESLRTILPHFAVTDVADLLAAIGSGTVSCAAVLNRLSPPEPAAEPPVMLVRGRANERAVQITAGDVANVEFKRSRCCLPIPGDTVLGYVTRGRGISLHHAECPNARNYLRTEPDRMMNVAYSGTAGQVFSLVIHVLAQDRTGLLADLSHGFSEMKTNITAVRTQSHRDGTATLAFTVEVRDVDHLHAVFAALRRVPDVYDILRPFGSRGIEAGEPKA